MTSVIATVGEREGGEEGGGEEEVKEGWVLCMAE